MRWGTGVHDLAKAILGGRPHLATGEQAAHVVEIMCAATESAASAAPIQIHSTFNPPAPMAWAEDNRQVAQVEEVSYE